MPRGVPLKCATLNLSWQANSADIPISSRSFSAVPVNKTGLPERPRGDPFSEAYRISARTLSNISADVVLLQELSVPDRNCKTAQDVASEVERRLFSDKYKVAASKLESTRGTWFGNMVLVSAPMAASFDFIDLRGADYYSHFNKRFGKGRPLAAAIMHEKGNTSKPIMLLCSAHSAHGMKWGHEDTRRTLTKIVMESVSAYVQACPAGADIDFSDMGVLFGGDLNTTPKNPCAWGTSVTVDYAGMQFTFHKVASKAIQHSTMRRDNPVPRDWIFCTSSVSKHRNPEVHINTNTGSDHYAVVAQTTSAMRAPEADQNRAFVDVPRTLPTA